MTMDAGQRMVGRIGMAVDNPMPPRLTPVPHALQSPSIPPELTISSLSRNCRNCSSSFAPVKPWQEFCSANCKQSWWTEIIAIEELELMKLPEGKL